MTAPLRVTATPSALAFIAEIQQDHPEILFHQSGGCCDGSSPMCYPVDDFRIGQHDVCLGELAGAKFYMSDDQYALWKHTQLILDVGPGRGAAFSLDNGREQRFLIRSRVFSEAEMAEILD